MLHTKITERDKSTGGSIIQTYFYSKLQLGKELLRPRPPLSSSVLETAPCTAHNKSLVHALTG